jgi:hypothetical protein
VTDPQSTPSEPLRFYRSFTVGPDFPSKLAVASFRYLLFSPLGLVRVLVVAIAFAVAAYLSTVQSNGQAYAFAIAGLGFLGFVVLIAVATAIGFIVERGRLRDRVPPGTEFAVGFRDATILMRSPMDTAEVAYTKYQAFEEVGDFVLLRQRSSRVLNFLPAECFTPESLAYLREKIPLPPKPNR